MNKIIIIASCLSMFSLNCMAVPIAEKIIVAYHNLPQDEDFIFNAVWMDGVSKCKKEELGEKREEIEGYVKEIEATARKKIKQLNEINSLWERFTQRSLPKVFSCAATGALACAWLVCARNTIPSRCIAIPGLCLSSYIMAWSWDGEYKLATETLVNANVWLKTDHTSQESE